MNHNRNAFASALRFGVRFWRIGAVLAPLFVVVLALMFLHDGGGSANRPLRIGFQNSPPYHFPDAHGNPSGPVVQLISEAARRKGIRLEWRWSPEGPENAIRQGKVDLWPIVVRLPERRGLIYITNPWARLSYVLVLPANSSIRRPEDAR